MFASLIVLMVTGLPIVFSLGAVGLIFSLFLWGPASLGLASTNLFGFMNDFILLAIPLFIFMAIMLEHSGIAEALYEMMYRWFGPLNGGLAMGTVAICAVIAAMSGLSAAGTLSMGIVALPSMLKRGYNKSISIGCIAAGGALGALIPPSVAMVVFSFLSSVSVGRMFLGGILPGILLAAIFIIYIGVRCLLSPTLCPALPKDERANWTEKISSLKLVILPILLIIAVLGSMFTGIATTTEAAAVGALGSIICAIVNRKLSWSTLKTTALGTLKLTSMLMWIMAAAAVFTSVYNGLGASNLIRESIMGMGINPWFVLIGMQVTLFFLGMILDPNGIMMITVPIYAPIIVSLGFDPIWFGILFVMNMEMAYLTPPFGWNIFYLKSVSPPGITLVDVYKAIVPFVGLQILGLALIMIFPQIALVLPDLFMGKG
jgi:tripartite ATP-independent transporter DctM subunit